jgi:F-type H+-transporting ATPase subunit delta
MASGAAKRYAQAVLVLAREQRAFDAWQRDLATLNTLMAEPRSVQYFTNPNVAEAEKRQVLNEMLAEAQPQARNLALLLLDRGRLAIVPDLFRIFNEARLEELGIAIAEVTTAEPLTVAEQAVVQERLGLMVGKSVELRMQTDPSIIGGIVARIGDILIDGSVVTRLRRLRTRLIEAEATA